MKEALSFEKSISNLNKKEISNKIDELLDKRSELKKNLDKVEFELNDMLMNQTDSQNKIDQQFSSNKIITERQEMILKLKTEIDFIDSQINELQNIKI